MAEREVITTRAHGIDISPWQEAYVFRDTWGQVDFAIQKMTEGTWWDYNYGRRWDVGVAEVGIRGMYHYQRSGVSWEAQANNILEMVTRVTPRIHIIAVDIEKGNNVLDRTFFADCGRVLDYLSTHSDRKVVQYINPDVFTLMYTAIKMNYPTYLQRWLFDYSMWLAQYWIFGRSPDKQPGTPKLRGDWDIWQYTDKGDSIVNGQRHYGSPDLDVFNGTVEEMRAWANVTDSPSPTDPPQGGDMTRKKVTIIWKEGARERSEPNTGSQSFAILPLGSVVYSEFDAVADSLDPTNPNKSWIQLESGKFIAVRYPVSAGDPTRATVEEVAPHPDPLPGGEGTTVDVAVKVAGATVGNVTVNDQEYIKK